MIVYRHTNPEYPPACIVFFCCYNTSPPALAVKWHHLLKKILHYVAIVFILNHVFPFVNTIRNKNVDRQE